MPVVNASALKKHANVLQITSKQMGNTRQQLLALVSNESLFDSRISEDFVAANTTYPIKKNDISQVVIFKTLMNKIGTIQQRIDALSEQLSNLDETSIQKDGIIKGIGKYAKYGFNVGFETLKLLRQTGADAYEMLKLINNAPGELKEILQPIYEQLYNAVSNGSKAIGIDDVAAEAALDFDTEQLGETVGATLGLDPTQLESGNIAQSVVASIFKLPDLLNKLNNLLSGDDIEPYDLEKLNQRQDQVFKELDQFLGEKREDKRFANVIHLVDKFYRLTRNVLEGGLGLSDSAYPHLVKQLQQMKQAVLPQLVAESELLEKNLGLKAGALSDKVLQQVTQLYDKTYEHVERAKAASEHVVEHNKGDVKLLTKQLLDLQAGYDKDIKFPPLQSKEFVHARLQHLSKSKTQSEQKIGALEADKKNCERFFSKIESFNVLLSNGKITDIPITDKLELRQLYREIQHHIAAESPEVDKKIIAALDIPYQQRIDEIKELGLTSQQKKLLAKALSQDTDAAISQIDDFKLGDDSKKFLKQIINDPLCEQSEFIDDLASLPDPIQSGILMGFAQRALSGAVAAASIVKYKVLSKIRLSSNEFAEISALKNTVNQQVDQKIANEKYKLDTVQRQINLAKDKYLTSTGQSNGIEIDLITEPYNYPDEVDPAAINHIDVVKAIQQELVSNRKKLNAFAGYSDAFFNELSVILEQNDSGKISLEDRRSLYKKFVEFQPLAAGIDPQNRIVEKRLINLITKGDPIPSELISEYQQKIQSGIELAKGYNDQQQQSIDNIKSNHSYTVDALAGAEIQPRMTMLSILSDSISAFNDLNIDDKIKQFKSGTLLPLLESKLSSRVLDGLDLQSNKDRIKIKPTHSTKEKNYIKLLNGITSVQELVSTFKTLTRKSAILNVLKEPSKLKVLFKISEIKELFKLVSQLEGTPGFEGVWQKIKEAVQPLSSLPFVGGTINKMINKVDVKISQKNMEMDEQLDTSTDLTQDPNQPQPTAQSNEEKQAPKHYEKLKGVIGDFLKFKAEISSEVPETTDETAAQLAKDVLEIQNLKNGFKKLKFDMKELQTSLNAVNALYSELASIVSLGKDKILSKLSLFSNEFMFEALCACDQAEIQLGLKPGELSQPIIDKIDDFYSGLISQLPLDSADKEMAYLAIQDNQNIQMNNRIERLQNYKAQYADDLHGDGVSVNHQQRCTEVKDALAYMSNNLPIVIFDDSEEGEAEKQKFHQLYQKLQPYLEKINKKYDKNKFLNSLNLTGDYKYAFYEIEGHEKRILKEVDKVGAQANADAMINTQLLDDSISDIEENHMHHIESLQSHRVEAYKEALLRADLKEIYQSAVTEDIKSQIPKPVRSKISENFIDKFSAELKTDDIGLGASKQEQPIAKQISDRCNQHKQDCVDYLEKCFSNYQVAKTVFDEFEAQNKQALNISNNPYADEHQKLYNDIFESLNATVQSGVVSDEQLADLQLQISSQQQNLDELAHQGRLYSALKTSDTDISLLELQEMIQQGELTPDLQALYTQKILAQQISDCCEQYQPFDKNIKQLCAESLAIEDFSGIPIDKLQDRISQSVSQWQQSNKPLLEKTEILVDCHQQLSTVISNSEKVGQLDPVRQRKVDFCKQALDQLNAFSTNEALDTIEERTTEMAELAPVVIGKLPAFDKNRVAFDCVSQMKAVSGNSSSSMVSRVDELEDILLNDKQSLDTTNQTFTGKLKEKLPLFSDTVGGKIKSFFYNIHKFFFKEQSADKLYLSESDRALKEKFTEIKDQTLPLVDTTTDIKTDSNAAPPTDTAPEVPSEMELLQQLEQAATPDSSTATSPVSTSDIDAVNDAEQLPEQSSLTAEQSTSLVNLKRIAVAAITKVEQLMLENKPELVGEVVDDYKSQLEAFSDQALVNKFCGINREHSLLIKAEAKTIKGMPEAPKDSANESLEHEKTNTAIKDPSPQTIQKN